MPTVNETRKTSATPIALIHWGTCADQRTVTGTLGTIVDIVKEEQIENPSMIIVGEVVNFHDRLNWFEKTGQHYYSFAQEAY